MIFVKLIHEIIHWICKFLICLHCSTRRIVLAIENHNAGIRFILQVKKKWASLARYGKIDNLTMNNLYSLIKYMKISYKESRDIWRKSNDKMKKLFYSCFSVLLVIILIIAMRHPDNNLIPSRMILFTLIWIVLLYGIRVFLQYIEKRIVKKGWNLRKI